MSDHDDFCESEHIGGGVFTACACAYRAARHLVTTHDRKVIAIFAGWLADEFMIKPDDYHQALRHFGVDASVNAGADE